MIFRFALSGRYHKYLPRRAWIRDNKLLQVSHSLPERGFMTISPELLVTKGLLPENVPPVFTTASIWSAFGADSGTYTVTGKVVGEPCVYNASKRGGQRRLFGVPHPTFVKDQGIFFQKHWTDIQVLFGAATGSLSLPTVDAVGARYVRITPHHELPRERLKRLSRFRFCLVTDVSRFYPSIYTHAFAWAINGKAASKADTHSTSSTVFGNRLDFIVRQSQSKQTIGLPIGPDSSKIAAEILMAAVDKRLIDLSGRRPPTYLRHVDDYWIGGHTHEECEKHLQNLRLALKEFGLDINETKTRVISTKYVFGETWPSELETELRQSLGLFSKLVGYDPMSTFGKIIDRATQDNDDGIIKHALRVIDEHKLWSHNWEIAQHFLAQCAIQFPHSFDYVARVISWRVRTNKEIDKGLWIDIARLVALQSARLGRDSEAVWAIWLLRELNQKIGIVLSDALISNCGALVLSFLSHFPQRKLATDKKLYDHLRDIVEGNPHAGAFWPLTLELVHLNEADSSWSGSTSPSALRRLHDARISMIDWSARPRVFVDAAPTDDGDPSKAIEDYGADYGSRGAMLPWETDGDEEKC
jgi:hypothetical protein